MISLLNIPILSLILSCMITPITSTEPTITATHNIRAIPRSLPSPTLSPQKVKRETLTKGLQLHGDYIVLPSSDLDPVSFNGSKSEDNFLLSQLNDAHKEERFHTTLYENLDENFVSATAKCTASMTSSPTTMHTFSLNKLIGIGDTPVVESYSNWSVACTSI